MTSDAQGLLRLKNISFDTAVGCLLLSSKRLGSVLQLTTKIGCDRGVNRCEAEGIVRVELITPPA
jgi:hypothetical protein